MSCVLSFEKKTVLDSDKDGQNFKEPQQVHREFSQDLYSVWPIISKAICAFNALK